MSYLFDVEREVKNQTADERLQRPRTLKYHLIAELLPHRWQPLRA